jgi:ribonuclease-3
MSVEKRDDPLTRLEQSLGYAFKDRALLETALTNPSYRADHVAERAVDNQRLEFLGDAVVGLLTAQFVYDRYGEEDEGGLTVRRSHLASGRGLADLARRVRLGDYLRLGKVDEAAGGREKSKALTDAMEAVFGAAWCDGGLAAVQAIFNSLSVSECEMPHDVWAENPKGELQELAQRHAWPDSPVYEQVEVAGPSHAPVYTVKAHVAGGYEALGTGLTKRSAEAAAAKALLALLKNAGVA